MKTKNNGLLIVVLVILVLILAFLFTNYGGLGKASVTERLQQYKSAEEGEACVIDANCSSSLVCDVNTNTCQEREGGGDHYGKEPSGHEDQTPGLPGSD